MDLCQQSDVFTLSSHCLGFTLSIFPAKKQLSSNFMADLIFLGVKITADGDYSHKIKRLLLLGRKTRTKLDSVLESIDITLPTKVCIVKAKIFQVIMDGCESWTIQKAES